MTLRSLLSAVLLSSFFVGGVAHAEDRLEGKRLADQLLLKNDRERGKLSLEAIAMTLRRHGARRAALRADFVRAHNNKYSNELPTTLIRDQKATGRCWIFTSLNVLERDATVRTGKPIALSRAYINARNLQLSAYEALDEAKGDAGNHKITEIDFGEGGYFQWATQLVDRFGVVPEHVMRDFSDSKASSTVLKLLETTVSNAQVKIAHAKPGELQAIVMQARAEIDRTVARAFIGKESLPTEFIVDGTKYTPKTYAEHLGLKADDYVALEDNHARGEGWRSTGDPKTPHVVSTYNTKDIELMKAAVRAAIDQGKKVYVSAPVNAASAPFMSSTPAMAGLPAAKGIMSLSAYDYATLGLPGPVTDRADVQARKLYPTNHAMTIVGYDLDASGKVVKWKVENSWGKSAADNGIQHMYDDFFTTLVGVVGVPRSALPPALAQKVATPPVRAFASK